MNPDLQKIFNQPNVIGVANLAMSAPLVKEEKFARTGRIALNACLRHFKAQLPFVRNIRELVPTGAESASLEFEQILGVMSGGCALALKEYLDDNFIGGDNIAAHSLPELALYDFLEHRTDLTRHILARSVATVHKKLHPSDAPVVGPVLGKIEAGLQTGLYNFIECRFVLEIQWIREPIDEKDQECVVFIFEEKGSATDDSPIIVTEPYRFTHTG